MKPICARIGRTIGPTLGILSWTALLLCTAGCQPPDSVPTSYYHIEEAPPPIVLAFPASGVTPLHGAALLQPLVDGLPERAQVVIQAQGPLAVARAHAVSRRLGRPVKLVAPSRAADLPFDQAVLSVRTPPGIVSDACRGPGSPGVEDLWPGDDDQRGVLLPPGCAVAAALQAQVVDQADLLRGRELPPGAAMPFAVAIEKYYHRNDAAMNGAATEPLPAKDSATPVSQAQAGSTANPLLGPLPH